MIKVTFYHNGFIATGHANSNVFGHDLVCAGVSAILMGALNWFDPQTSKIDVKDNYIKVIIYNPEKLNHLLDLLFIQLSAMIHGNKQYITIQKTTKNCE